MKKFSPDELTALAANVDRLSRLLTAGRADLPAAYLRDPGLREAYLAYFLPSNLGKIHAPLHELSLHPGKPLDRKKLRVLDLGCGPGTASLGALGFFSSCETRPWLEFIAVDQVSGNLEAAQDLFTSLRNETDYPATFRTVRSGIEDLSPSVSGPFELVILSNVLNELFGRDGRKIQKRLVVTADVMQRLLADDGSLIIIEPALRETSRDMLMLRDGLLAEGFHVYAPCPRTGTCPALANPKDWCHEDLPWDAPPLVREMDKLTGLRKDSLKFSWLVMRKDDHSVFDVFGKDAFRVVSEPLVTRGKRELYLCGRQGRRLAIRLNKDETKKNEAFGALRRGDVVGFDGLIDEEKRYKIGKETGVVLVPRSVVP